MKRLALFLVLVILMSISLISCKTNKSVNIYDTVSQTEKASGDTSIIISPNSSSSTNTSSNNISYTNIPSNNALSKTISVTISVDKPKNTPTRTPTPKKEKPKITVDSILLSRYGTTYGKLKMLPGITNPEFEYNSKYFVLDPQSGVSYCFTAENWTAQDSDYCYKIEAKLKKIAPGIDGQMSIEAFTKNLTSVGYEASYQIKQGAGTAAYIADRYAEVHFGGTDGTRGEDPGFGAVLYIELLNNNMVLSDSLTWLQIVAG